jgi:hypothetical protein
MNRSLPFVVEMIVSADEIQPERTSEQLRELGRQHGLDYIVFVLASHTEQEYPITVLLGGTTHAG